MKSDRKTVKPPKRKTVKQCESCPWRVGCVPEEDIPGYRRELHAKLSETIQSGLESLNSNRVMACHYSTPRKNIHCAGWLNHQLGEGNNIGLRFRLLRGELPVPEVDGPQHETFEDTLK
jgi:hypothetical protein